MANEVCTSLGLVGKDLTGKLIQIVEEDGSSASFMISSLIWNASRSDISVCLLALHNNTTHYQNVCKKLGLNLKSAIDCKTITILEPSNMFTDKCRNFSKMDMQDEANMKQLFIDIKEALSLLSGKKCLIIDDVSDLLCLGSNVSLVIMFLQCCRALQESDSEIALIICSHCSEENNDQNVVSNFIAHISDYRITISGLKTGFSANVTGSLKVVDNLQEECITGIENKLFHFKLTDRQVKVFAPGSVGIYA